MYYMEFHPHEVKVLKSLRDKSTSTALAEKTGLSHDAVLRAGSWLLTKSLVGMDERLSKEITLGSEGTLYAEKGLPERQIASFVKKSASMSDVKKKFDGGVFTVGLGWLRRKRMASLDGGVITVLNAEEGDDERLLKTLAEKGVLQLDKLDEKQFKAFELLNSRQNVIKLSEKREIYFTPTEEGIRLSEGLDVKDEISQLTPEMLLSGGWKEREFRPYDAGVYIRPAYPAKKHPIQVAMAEIRDVFLRMGFSEIKGPLVESCFWNFDALFTPQDHPARDLHDTFYLKQPKEVEIPAFERLKEAVKATHENGWTTGSTGWQYSWDEKMARKVVLRTHTTAVTARYLSTLKKENLPAKVFCIGKVFRNEAVDYKHLPEFYQVEGIIVDEKANFRNLLGVLKRFYDEMGFKVRFRPGYFPYTEMSVEPEIYFKPKDEWIELGGAGIFRPEVVKPLLGFDCPVLAWGLGLDRVVALRMGLSDIRELYMSNLGWLRTARSQPA
jgi:phenylalanyl-tRNA synthetase alpha chain